MDLRIALSCLLVAGGAIGIALPFLAGEDATSRAPTDASGSPASAAPFENTPAQAQSTSGWTEEVVLEREADGHFYADVMVDGQPVRMLIDTGASVVALTADDASAMGLYWHEQDVSQVAQGASGAVHGVGTVIDRIGIGQFEASGVEAVIIPEGLGISLLGQSYLSTLGKVEISGNRMVLGS